MAQNSIDLLLLDLELFPHELRKIEEAYNKVNGILKGTFGTEAFIVGNFQCTILIVKYIEQYIVFKFFKFFFLFSIYSPRSCSE